MPNFLKSRRVKYGSNTFIAVLIVLGILVTVNVLANRYHRRIDTTEGQFHSLSDQTVTLLGSLKVDVNVVAFFRDRDRRDYERMLKEYAYHSSRFSYRFVDPDREPGERKRYRVEVEVYNTSVIEAGDREDRITSTEETDLTNAIARAIRGEDKVVYFLTGHGEASTFRRDRAGYSSVKQALRDANYGVSDSLMLVQAERVPEDCSLLIVAGPKTGLLQIEVASIQSYLREGGAGMFLLDPGVESGLEPVLKEWAIGVNNDFIVGNIKGLGRTFAVAESYGRHPVTAKHASLATFFPLARSLTREGTIPATETVVLVKTSRMTWAETDLSWLKDKKAKMAYNSGEDRPGPLPVAMAVKGPPKSHKLSASDRSRRKTRIVVFGDSDFANNQFFSQAGNGDLFLNAVNWLLEEGSLIAIRPKARGYRPLFLTDSDREWIFWLSLVLLPAVPVVVGVGVWWRRR